MTRFGTVSNDPDHLPPAAPRRAGLDERFLAQILPETPLDRVEGQELRQIVARALLDLTPDELKVVELRFERKRSPGQTASRLGLTQQQVSALESAALDKLRGPLTEYMET